MKRMCERFLRTKKARKSAEAMRVFKSEKSKFYSIDFASMAAVY